MVSMRPLLLPATNGAPHKELFNSPRAEEMILASPRVHVTSDVYA